MISHLAQHHPDVHKAVLRGAIASAYMNDIPTSDRAVWVPGTKTPDGRLPGIAETTLSALREIGLLNEIDQTEDVQPTARGRNGVITYPSAVVEESSYESVGVKNAWFGIYQRSSWDAGEVVPERPQDLDKATSKEAKKQFKKAARDFSETDITIKEEQNKRTGKKELIAYIDKTRLGEVSNPEQLADGQKITIKCSFARSGNLRIAYESEVIPISKTDSANTRF